MTVTKRRARPLGWLNGFVETSPIQVSFSGTMPVALLVTAITTIVGVDVEQTNGRRIPAWEGKKQWMTQVAEPRKDSVDDRESPCIPTIPGMYATVPMASFGNWSAGS
jgi:hypothetical protein